MKKILTEIALEFGNISKYIFCLKFSYFLLLSILFIYFYFLSYGTDMQGNKWLCVISGSVLTKSERTTNFVQVIWQIVDKQPT